MYESVCDLDEVDRRAKIVWLAPGTALPNNNYTASKQRQQQWCVSVVMMAMI